MGESEGRSASLVALHELDEHAASGGGMEEGYPVTTGSGASLAVDQRYAFGLEELEIGVEVGGAICDVVKRRPSAVEEAAYRGIGMQGLQQLDGPDEGDTNALGLEGLRRGTRLAGEEFEQVPTLFDGVDGDRDVVDDAVRPGDVSHRRMLHSAH